MLAGAVIVLAAGGPAAAQVSAPDPGTTVVVKAKPPAVIHKPDRTIYRLDGNGQATAGSVSDVLNTLPSVSLDPNGNVSVRGGSVQVLVDGKPSAALRGDNLGAALQSMPANTVDRVEVITNPGAEFRSDASAVINIITRRPKGAAPSGLMIINAGPQARYNTTLSGSAGIGRWKLNGSLALRQDIRHNASTTNRTNFGADGVPVSRMVQDGALFIPYGHVTLDAGAAYSATDRDTLSLDGEVSIRRRPRRGVGHTTYLDPAGAVLSAMTTTSQARQVFNSASLTGTWRHKGQRDGEILTVQARHEEDENLSGTHYLDTYTMPLTVQTMYRWQRTNRDLDDELSGDYVLPLGENTQFKTGFDFENESGQFYNYGSTFDLSTGDETADPALTRRFVTGRQYAAAYIDYQHPMGRWVAEAGLRAESLATRLRERRDAPATDLSDTQWSPSLYFSRTLSDTKGLRFGYSHRIDRPSVEQLNPLPWVLGPQDIFVGNPRLRPAQTASFEAGYDYTTKPLSFSATLYVRRTRDVIAETRFYADAGDSVLVSTPVNAGRDAREGLDMSLDMHPSKAFGVTFSSDIFHVRRTHAPDGISRAILSHQTKLSLTWAPTTTDSLQLQAQLNGQSLLADGVQDAMTTVNLTWVRTLSRRLKLVVTGNDLFDGNLFRQHTQTAQFRDNTVVRIPGRIVYLGLKYSLGAIVAGN